MKLWRLVRRGKGSVRSPTMAEAKRAAEITAAGERLFSEGFPRYAEKTMRDNFSTFERARKKCEETGSKKMRQTLAEVDAILKLAKQRKARPDKALVELSDRARRLKLLMGEKVD